MFSFLRNNTLSVVRTDPVELKFQVPSAAIISQPANVAVISGKNIRFQIEANGTDLTCQRYRSNDKGATWTRTFLSGYSSDTLSLDL